MEIAYQVIIFPFGFYQYHGHLGPGEGAVVKSGLKKMAVYRNDKNILHACSAICPQLHANFIGMPNKKPSNAPHMIHVITVEGTVINGPASSDLKPMMIKEEQLV